MQYKHSISYVIVALQQHQRQCKILQRCVNKNQTNKQKILFEHWCSAQNGQQATLLKEEKKTAANIVRFVYKTGVETWTTF